jgi:hypothetical protein
MSSIAERRALIKKAALDRRTGRHRDGAHASTARDSIIVTIKRHADGLLRHGAVPPSSTVVELLEHLQLSTNDHHLRLGHEVRLPAKMTTSVS